MLTVTRKAPNPGVNWFSSSNAWDCPPHPKLAIGDGSLGFWIALQEEYGPITQQRCWVHKTADILDKMPKSVQGKAKQPSQFRREKAVRNIAATSRPSNAWTVFESENRYWRPLAGPRTRIEEV